MKLLIRPFSWSLVFRERFTFLSDIAIGVSQSVGNTADLSKFNGKWLCGKFVLSL
jgi:hypothetical protein